MIKPCDETGLKKEITKWLDVSVIYPILDNEWVSPVQCVSKKGRKIVVTNEENQLILTITITGLPQAKCDDEERPLPLAFY